jgi:hypothetical protein
MSTAIFPAEWWNAAAQVYESAVLSMKSLFTRESDTGTKDVSNVSFED